MLATHTRTGHFLSFLKAPISAVPLLHVEREVRVERMKNGVKLSSVVPVWGDSWELAWLIAYQRAISKLIAM